MAKKVLLARFTRGKKGGGTETLLPDGKAVDLSADDLKTLDRLAEVTGKRYYRDPVNESATEDERPDADEPTFAETFVDRNLSEISDDDISALGADNLSAVIEAEKAGRNRKSLVERLEAAAAAGSGGGGDKDEGL